LNAIRRRLLSLALALATIASACSASSAAPAGRAVDSISATPTVQIAADAPIAVAEPTPALAPATEPTASSIGAAPDISGVAAKRHVEALANEIGSRSAGSPNHARAAQYVIDQLRGFGYQAELQPFSFTSYDDRGSSLTVSGALGRELQANTLVYSPAGTVEGRLVDAGLGRPGDFAPAAVRGNVALMERGEIRFSEKVENVAQAGASAAVVFNNQPLNFNGNLATESRIPAVSVSHDDGETLLAQARQGSLSVRLAVDASLEPRMGANAIATKPGGPQTVVIGAHLDSVSAGPGANDNASGTAVMLELARVVAARPPPFTLVFAAFDAEEIGLIGSGKMVEALTHQQQRSIRAMINLDMVGVGDQPRLGGSDELTSLAYPIAARLGQTARPIGDGLNGGSDHASFIRAGIPALFIYRSEDPNYHTPNDQAPLVRPENLEFAARLALGVLDNLPAER